MKKILVCLVALVLLCGCASEKSSQDSKPRSPGTSEEAVKYCIDTCSEEKGSGVDLSNGPCLHEQIAADWVCDVAHNPRIEIDNRPENQCQSFSSGLAHHFVEVDDECNLIRAV
jgi:uncharacterized protein YceK